MPVSLTWLPFSVVLGDVSNQPTPSGQKVFSKDLQVQITGFVYITLKSSVSNIAWILINGEPYESNSGIEVAGGAGYTFKIPVKGGDTVNVYFAMTTYASVHVHNSSS